MKTQEEERGQTDGCPPWAQETIEQLRQIEVFLGNIPKALAWQSSHLNDVVGRSFQKEGQVFDEGKAELVFKRIVRGLAAEGYSQAEIAAFVNRRIGFDGAPPYCNESEVGEALAR